MCFTDAQRSLLEYLKQKDWSAASEVLRKNSQNTQADLDFFFKKGLVDFKQPFGSSLFIKITDKGCRALLSIQDKVGGYIVEHWIELCILIISTATLIFTLWGKKN